MRINAKQYVTVICCGCKIQFDKEKKEFDRQIKYKHKDFYCSKECFKSNNHTHYLDEFSPFRGILTLSKKNAKAKGFKFDLDLMYLKGLWEQQNGICAYTNIKMILAATKSLKQFLPKTVSLDRIDSNIGYIKGNVQFVCLAANYAKNGFLHKEIVEFFNAVRDNKPPEINNLQLFSQPHFNHIPCA